MKITDEMVSRFLAWQLPKEFAPDGGVAFTPPQNPHHAWPVGTNLLTATQARVMLEHVLVAEPAPAREPAVEEVNAAKKEGCFITAVGSYYQNVVGLDVALRHAGELDRLRAENAALREQLQGGVVVPEEVAARFSGDITIPKTLLAEAYRGLKRHYEMPEVRREIDRLFAAAKETKK